MSKPIIAITAGDTNGIGYEVILKALINPEICDICKPVVYGNAAVAKVHQMMLDEEYHNIQFHIIESPEQIKDGKLNLITCYPDTLPVSIGKPDSNAGEAAKKSLQRAVGDLQKGLVDALVTGPINKDTIQGDGFHFPGHTEYLTSVFGQENNSLMMMLSDSMRVALLCNHTPISQVAQMVTKERILEKIKVLDNCLRSDFRIRKPRIAVLALNPHAGDNGLLGSEEKEVIRPAIDTANQDGFSVFGPYAADGFFGAKEYRHFDAVLAMYHDQGLTPFKSLDMSGVNYTAGLTIVRTSPDHGTAYDIAGKNIASPESMLHAIYAAIDILKCRIEWKQLNTNPLPFIVREPNEDKRPPKPLNFVKESTEEAEE